MSVLQVGASALNPMSPLRTHRLQFRVEWVAATAIVLMVGLACCVALVRDLWNIEAQEGDRLRVQANVVEENLLRQLHAVNRALAAVRYELVRGQLGDAAGSSARLKLLSDAMPGVRTMTSPTRRA
jgi:hypothetical protein